MLVIAVSLVFDGIFGSSTCVVDKRANDLELGLFAIKCGFQASGNVKISEGDDARRIVRD